MSIHPVYKYQQGSQDFQEKNLGATWPLSLVASKRITISEKYGKLVASEKNLVTLATQGVSMLSSDQPTSTNLRPGLHEQGMFQELIRETFPS